MDKKDSSQTSKEYIKIIALGDTHGRPFWKDIVKSQTYDKLIFIGDYFDTKEEVTAKVQIDNFIAICKYKESNPGKVILLIGNHDYHYLDGTSEKYSGFQPDYYDAISSLLHESLENRFMQMSFVSENILFTHAGVTKTWCKENDVNVHDIQNFINDLFMRSPERFGYSLLVQHGGLQMSPGISPIWVRPENLIPDKIDDFIQVVGHTQQPRIRFTDDVIFIDTLSTSKEYLVIEEGKFMAAVV